MTGKSLILTGIVICVLSLFTYYEVSIDNGKLTVNRYDAWGLWHKCETAINCADIRDVLVTGLDGVQDDFNICLTLRDGTKQTFPSDVFGSSLRERAERLQRGFRKGIIDGTYHRRGFIGWGFAMMGGIFSVAGLLILAFNRHRNEPKRKMTVEPTDAAAAFLGQ